MALTKTEVSMLYVSIFNRASEGNGNEFWQTHFDDMAKAADEMLKTEDAKAYFGDTLDSNQAFIEWIYKNTLNKTATDDPDGIAYWTGLLDNGATRGEVVAGLVNAVADYENSTDPVTKAAYDQFMNRVAVSDYTADKLSEAPADYKTKLGFDGDLAVTADRNTIHTAEAAVDALASNGSFVMTPEVDSLILTNGNDTITGETSTVGVDDVIVDPSINDNDTLNIEASSDVPAFSATNVENINVNFATFAGTVDASNFTGATVGVSAKYDSEATVSNLGKNNAKAGDHIATLTVDGLTSGVVDTGSATQANITVAAATDSINLKVNSDVSLDATTAYTDLNVEATADAKLDISNSTANFTGDGKVTGDGNLTIKTKSAQVSGKTIVNEGNGELTIEATDDDTLDMSKIDAKKLILDSAAAGGNTITFKDDLDVTATQSANTDMKLKAAADNSTGGSTPSSVVVHLTKVAANDKITTDSVLDVTVEAQKAGTIDTIDTTAGTNVGNLTIANKGTSQLTVSNTTVTGKSVNIAADSTEDISLQNLDANVVVAGDFKYDLTINEVAASTNQLAIMGAKGKNSITTTTTDKAVNIITQDSDDILNIATTSGRLTVKTADGKDKVTAEDLTDSTASFDTGAGDDTLSVKVDGTGTATIDMDGGKDTLTVKAGTTGTVNADMGADDDTVNLEKLGAGGSVTLNLGEGNDLAHIDSDAADSITIDAGDGTDIVDVEGLADFTNSTLELSNVEEVKIDNLAKFLGSQVSEKTFKVSSGTATPDVMHVTLDTALATDNEKSYDFSTMDFNNTPSHKVDYFVVDASNSATDNTIVGAHNISNYMVLSTEADKHETIKLFADSMGISVVDANEGVNSVVNKADIETIKSKGEDTVAKVSTDIAIIENFDTDLDSIDLDIAATAQNYTEVDVDYSMVNHGIDNFIIEAIDKADTEMSTDDNLVYVLAYNNNAAKKTTEDAFLLVDTDNDQHVDSAILFVGLNDGTGDWFAASDIV